MTDRIDEAIRTAQVTRRHFLAGSAMAGFATFLAACGAPGQGSSAPTSGSATAAPGTDAARASEAPATEAPAATGGGTLNFANWIGYIDVAEDGTTHPTLDKFTSETGIEVNYREAVDDNETFFTSDLQAPLSANLPTDWDIVVVTDWMVARLARLGWLDPINLANTPNLVANLLDSYKGRSFDPDNNLSAPWQSGMTGIGYDKGETGDLSSLAVLWDPANKGKVTYLTEMRDTIGLAALKLGFDPATITEEQFQGALAEVDKAVKAEIPRSFTGNSYTEDMLAGNAILGMAWSGDVVNILQVEQTGSQDFQWALPSEGGMLWTDNMVLPKGAKNKGQAEIWINFYYEPVNAAVVEAWVYYVCPVKGAREAMIELDPELAENPLIFPTDEMSAKLHVFRGTTAEEETAWAEAFAGITGV